MVQIKQDVEIKNLDGQITWSVETLLSLVKNFYNKKNLFDEGETIFLQVSIFKIPQVDEIVRRSLSLKHPPYAGKPEVCFIVRDFIRRDRIKRTPDEMIDCTIERYEDFFKKQRVTGITTIMPYYQLKTEYNTFELRRKLVNRFDVFLCSSSLFSQIFFFRILGKEFICKNKYPMGVKLPALNAEYDPNINKRIQCAIASTNFRIREGSSNYCIRIGTTLNKKKEIKENLKCLLDKILNSDFIPGGIENIRLIGLKTSKSKIVPLYISMSSGANVQVPYVEPNYPMKKSVEGEVSTVPGKKVTVLPSGQIFVTPMKDHYDDDDFEEEDESIDDEGDDNMEEEDENDGYVYRGKRGESGINRKKGKNDSDNDEDEDEDEAEEQIEFFEQKYLSDWNENVENNEEEEEKIRKGRKRKWTETSKTANKTKMESTKPLKKGENQTKTGKKEALLARKTKDGTTPAKRRLKNDESPSKLVKEVKKRKMKSTKAGMTERKVPKIGKKLKAKGETPKETNKGKQGPKNKDIIDGKGWKKKMSKVKPGKEMKDVQKKIKSSAKTGGKLKR